MYTFVSRPRGVRWWDHLSRITKQINLFAIWQKKYWSRSCGMRWTSVHWDDIFMGQMCYGDFSYANNMEAFFKIFCMDLKGKLLGSIIYACACVSIWRMGLKVAAGCWNHCRISCLRFARLVLQLRQLMLHNVYGCANEICIRINLYIRSRKKNEKFPGKNLHNKKLVIYLHSN